MVTTCFPREHLNYFLQIQDILATEIDWQLLNFSNIVVLNQLKCEQLVKSWPGHVSSAFNLRVASADSHLYVDSKPEPSPESLQQMGFTFVKGGLTISKLTKLHKFLVFHISIWGAYPTKAARGDGTAANATLNFFYGVIWNEVAYFVTDRAGVQCFGLSWYGLNMSAC